MSDEPTPRCPACEDRSHRTFSVEEQSANDDGAHGDDRVRTVRTLAECQNCGNVYNPRTASRN